MSFKMEVLGSNYNRVWTPTGDFSELTTLRNVQRNNGLRTTLKSFERNKPLSEACQMRVFRDLHGRQRSGYRYRPAPDGVLPPQPGEQRCKNQTGEIIRHRHFSNFEYQQGDTKDQQPACRIHRVGQSVSL